MSGSALNESCGGCAADAPGRVGSGDIGTAQHTHCSTHCQGESSVAQA